jgi:hypothetical protein
MILVLLLTLSENELKSSKLNFSIFSNGVCIINATNSCFSPKKYNTEIRFAVPTIKVMKMTYL